MPRVVCPARARDPRDAVLRPPRPPPPRRFLPPRLGPAPRARTDTSVRARARAAWRCTPALGVHLSMRATGPLERAWLRTFGVRKELRVGEERARSMAHPGFNLGGRKQRVLWQCGHSVRTAPDLRMGAHRPPPQTDAWIHPVPLPLRLTRSTCVRSRPLPYRRGKPRPKPQPVELHGAAHVGGHQRQPQVAARLVRAVANPAVKQTTTCCLH